MGRTTTAAVDVTGDVRTLPAGFPAHVNTRLAWTGAQFANSSEYVLTLTDAHICEIQGALAHFKSMSCRLVSSGGRAQGGGMTALLTKPSRGRPRA